MWMGRKQQSAARRSQAKHNKHTTTILLLHRTYGSMTATQVVSGVDLVMSATTRT
jgi:hypothetical protein